MFSMGLLGTAITDYVGVGQRHAASGPLRPPDLARRGARHSTIVVTGKRKEGGAHLVDLECAWPTATARRRWSARPPPSCPTEAVGLILLGSAEHRSPLAWPVTGVPQKAPKGGTDDVVLEEVALVVGQLLRCPLRSRLTSPAGVDPPHHPDVAAEDDEVLAADVGGLVGGEESDQRGHVLGPKASNLPSSALAMSPKRSSVMRVRARGEMALTVTP